MIDWTISFGMIIQSIVVIGGGLVVYGSVQRTIKDMEKDVSQIEIDLKQLSRVVASIAVQDQRLNRIEEDIRELRHGAGFILPSPQARRQEDQ